MKTMWNKRLSKNGRYQVKDGRSVKILNVSFNEAQDAIYEHRRDVESTLTTYCDCAFRIRPRPRFPKGSWPEIVCVILMIADGIGATVAGVSLLYGNDFWLTVIFAPCFFILAVVAAIAARKIWRGISRWSD